MALSKTHQAGMHPIGQHPPQNRSRIQYLGSKTKIKNPRSDIRSPRPIQSSQDPSILRPRIQIPDPTPKTQDPRCKMFRPKDPRCKTYLPCSRSGGGGGGGACTFAYICMNHIYVYIYICMLDSPPQRSISRTPKTQN